MDGHDSSPSDQPKSSTTGYGHRQSTERTAGHHMRTNNRTGATFQSTVRAVTPEPTDDGHATVDTNTAQSTRGYGAASPQQTSPRSAHGGERRRQGIVFYNDFGESYDDTSSAPVQQRATIRARTQTMDGALNLRQQLPASSPESRHRVGSFSSASPQPLIEAGLRPPITIPEPLSHVTGVSRRLQEGRNTSSSNKEKKNNRRLIKRAGSRPSSPLISPRPSVDSLPIPIPTEDANKILLLMKALCGRMKGEIEYSGEPNGPWLSGICYIDEERGSLLFDSGQAGQVAVPVVGDLRGCRVLPVELPEDGRRCLELSNQKMGIEVLLRPLNPDELDLWLASLLCWQQVGPSNVRLASNRSVNSSGSVQASTKRRGSTIYGPTSKDAAIIKVGKVMLWDKGVASTPRAIVKRPSTRDLRSGSTSWKNVSCMLQDNGEFKLMTESDQAVLSVIDLTQLSRCAIQRLDKSVLDEEYCIAIFPIYSTTSRQLSIFRPIYVALDSRVLLEVWFVLLRAFALPDLYGLQACIARVVEVRDLNTEFDGQIFRIEKTISVRVTEAKISKSTVSSEHHDRHVKDRDPFKGNYLAEVILDGEVRSRTTTQTDTARPFWRENALFTDLPTTLPYLSVVLKRVDGNLDSCSHQLQASLGLPKTGNLTEITCGAVDIPLDKLERAKDHEQWFQIYDGHKETIGSMFVKVYHDELVVLTSRDYATLSELLHKFSTGLVSQIAQAIPSQMRRLADTFLNIFQVSGAAHEWLTALVEEEIDGIGSQNTMKGLRFSRRLKSNESSTSASEREHMVREMNKSLTGEANLLFRGNTLLTQALECHMRRLGKEYIDDILGEKVFEINEINPDCEVDPSRISNADDMHQHWEHLIQFTTELWECIAVSATRLPVELRQILKYVQIVAESRYGNFLQTVSYTSVSGFLFLRFICPAILNPKLFGLLRDIPRPRAQRTLTLVAKGLQALANMSTFGKKESWMEPMNRFLNAHKQSFKGYINQICSVPAERNVVTVSASYSSPIAILGRLSPISREGFPSLPYLIDHQRNFAALVKIWLEGHRYHKLGDADPFEGELAQFHAICVTLQERSDICGSQMEKLRAEENESLYTDDVTESLEKASLMGSNLSTGNLHWAQTDPYFPTGSSDSEPDVGDRPGFLNTNREGRSLRHVSASSDLSHSSMRAKGRGSRDPRSFLSGLIGGKKGKDSASSSAVRDKSRDKEDGKGGSGKGILGSWQDGSSRH